MLLVLYSLLAFFLRVKKLASFSVCAVWSVQPIFAHFCFVFWWKPFSATFLDRSMCKRALNKNDFTKVSNGQCYPFCQYLQTFVRLTFLPKFCIWIWNRSIQSNLFVCLSLKRRKMLFCRKVMAGRTRGFDKGSWKSILRPIKMTF